MLRSWYRVSLTLFSTLLLQVMRCPFVSDVLWYFAARVTWHNHASRPAYSGVRRDSGIFILLSSRTGALDPDLFLAATGALNLRDKGTCQCCR